jgi:hypothetical protein
MNKQDFEKFGKLIKQANIKMWEVQTDNSRDLKNTLKVLINFKNLYFYRVKRKESLRCWLFEQMEMLLIWVRLHAMCMEYREWRQLDLSQRWQ